MTKNSVYVQNNGFVLVTPKNESTLVLTTKQVCDACKKQIPKKPTPDNKYFGFGICPTCNAVFFDNSTKHCGNCGQALDWSEFIEQGRKELEKLGIVKLHR